MTILITGANRGIGLELVRKYVAQGRKVIATTRRDIPADLENLATWHVLDVTDQGSFDKLNNALDGAAISLLICNAGVYIDKGQSLDSGFGADIWAQSFAANAMGPFLTAQNLLPNLQAGDGGKIAIVASQMGSNALAKGGSYAYRASKAAAINLGSNLATDLGHLGIAVGVFHPGWVKTDMGGDGADIDAQTAAEGLVKRFDALSMDTTGCFEAYDGNALRY